MSRQNSKNIKVKCQYALEYSRVYYVPRIGKFCRKIECKSGNSSIILCQGNINAQNKMSGRREWNQSILGMQNVIFFGGMGNKYNLPNEQDLVTYTDASTMPWGFHCPFF